MGKITYQILSKKDLNGDGIADQLKLRCETNHQQQKECTLEYQQGQADGTFFTEFKNYTRQTEQVILGNSAVAGEIIVLLKRHGKRTDSIKTTTPWDAVKFPIETQIIGDQDFNHDGHSDFLLIRAFTLYANPQKQLHPKTVFFVGKILGNENSDTTQKPSDESITQTDLVWEGADSVEKQFAADRALFGQLSEVATYASNTTGYFALSRAEKDKFKLTSQAAATLMPTTYNRLSFALNRLKERYQAIISNPDLSQFYEKKDPRLLPFMKALVIQSQMYLTFTEQEEKRYAELITQGTDDLYQKAADSYFPFPKNPEKKVTRKEWMNLLRETSSPKERARLFRTFNAHFHTFHQKEGGLLHEVNGRLPVVDELNQMAKNHGFLNYPDFLTRVNYAIRLEDFDAVFERYSQEHDAEIASFTQKLRKLNGGNDVYEWDLDYLKNQFVREQLGGKNPPTLRFDSAVEVAKTYFRDLGWDLDKAPFKDRIIFDTSKRENKHALTVAIGEGDGSRAWFHANFSPDAEITLQDLSTIIHELTHDVQYILASQKAGKSALYGFDSQPRLWAEGIAMAMSDVVFDEAWMAKYLAPLPPFADPKLRKAISEVEQKSLVWEQMLYLCRARWEIQLYQTEDAHAQPRSVEERLKIWPDLVKKYLHLSAEDDLSTLAIYSQPHFYSSLIVYVTYSGRAVGTEATELLRQGIAEGNREKIKAGASRIRNIFVKGAKASTTEEVLKLISDQ